MGAVIFQCKQTGYTYHPNGQKNRTFCPAHHKQHQRKYGRIDWGDAARNPSVFDPDKQQAEQDHQKIQHGRPRKNALHAGIVVQNRAGAHHKQFGQGKGIINIENNVDNNERQKTGHSEQAGKVKKLVLGFEISIVAYQDRIKGA